MWEGPPAPFVNHGEVVSEFECFSFGVHKFLKAAQRGRGIPGLPHKANKYVRHMRNCARIRDLYRRTGARRHQLALAGVTWAMEHRELSSLSSKADLEDIFEREVRDQPRLRRHVDRLASSLVLWRLALLRSLGRQAVFA
jgi:hypothetical protein